MLTASDFQARQKAAPFVPFRVIMSSVQEYEVTHPELMFVTRRFVTVTVATPSRRDPKLGESTAQLSMLHIADVLDLDDGTQLWECTE